MAQEEYSDVVIEEEVAAGDHLGAKTPEAPGQAKRASTSQV